LFYDKFIKNQVFLVQVLAKAGIMDHESRRWNRDEEQVTRSVARIELKSITPREAIEWYLDHRRDEVRMATRRKHESSLGYVRRLTDDVGLADFDVIHEEGERIIEPHTGAAERVVGNAVPPDLVEERWMSPGDTE
jgi:hypothetical protein